MNIFEIYKRQLKLQRPPDKSQPSEKFLTKRTMNRIEKGNGECVKATTTRP